MAEDKKFTREYFSWPVLEDSTPDEICENWQKRVPPGGVVFTPKILFEYPNEQDAKDEKNNLNASWKLYDALEKKIHQSDYDSGILPIVKKGTVLKLPAIELTLIIEDRLKTKKQFSQANYATLWSKNYKSIVNDPKYVPLENITTESEQGLVTKMISVNARVYLYCKAIDSVIDISPFVASLTVDKTLETGNFTISVMPFRSLNVQKVGDTYVELFNTVADNKYHVKDFLEKTCQFNDIVFICFERLQNEKAPETRNLIVNKEDLPSDKNIWDMIGFVDKCSTQSDAEGTSRYTNIEGRDIGKLLSDDGSYFLPLKEVEGSNEWVNLGDENSQFFQRNVLKGCYDFIWSTGFKTIEETVWFIINICSNLGLVESDLFSAWKEKRISSFPIDGVREMKVNGIWQIVKVYLDEAASSRILIDSSFGNPNGTLMSLMQRAIQTPLMEFFFDTYQDTIDFTVRQPPFNQKAIKEVVDSGTYVIIDSSNVIEMNLAYDTRFYSWYQIYAQNDFAKAMNANALAMVPIVYLEEYTKYFGNKKLEVGDMYLEAPEKTDNWDPLRINNYQKAALNDLQYIIESNAYLPFTRTGTIVIIGDRRIKIGTFVQNPLTNEFFYVTGVTNTAEFSANSVERRTILNVERGMYWPILKKMDSASVGVMRKDNSIDLSDANTLHGPSLTSMTPDYFSLVNLDPIKQSILNLEKDETKSVTLIGSVKVDKKQFEYFLKRKMFGY